MAFVSEFTHDVFISYAQVDNNPETGIAESCWVTNIRNALQTGLDGRLGRNQAAKIWMDLQGLRGNEPVTPEIHEAISSSAVLVLVLSTGYMASKWCGQERDLFAGATGGADKLGKRVFVLIPDEMPMEHWPEPLRDRIGYRFYVKSPEGEIVRLGKPKPNPEQKEYFRVLDKLYRELSAQLLAMKENGPAPPIVPHDPAKTVFVSEVCSELDEEHDKVVESLKGAGYTVMPTRFLSRAPTEFREQMKADLSQCSFYVQLLGQRATRASDTETYDMLQADVAKTIFAQRLDSMLFWHSPAVDLGKAKGEHRAFIESLRVEKMDFHELLPHLLHVLQQRGMQRPVGQNRLLLVNAAREDQDLATQLSQVLADSGLDYDFHSEDKSVADVAMVNDQVHGLMVVFGKNHEDWVRDQVRKMRTLVLQKKASAPKCGVYIAPPENRELLCHFQQLVRIKNQGALKQFLADVAH
jgi:hypothetical protein